MTTTHSPLPWDFIHDRNHSRISPAYGQFQLAKLESDGHRADAEFIVRAVNNHAKLVDALKGAYEALLGMQEAWGQTVGLGFDGDKGSLESVAALLKESGVEL